jgi:hypothetical protein
MTFSAVGHGRISKLAGKSMVAFLVRLNTVRSEPIPSYDLFGRMALPTGVLGYIRGITGGALVIFGKDQMGVVAVRATWKARIPQQHTLAVDALMIGL